LSLTEDAFKFADEFGPEKIIHIYEPRTKMKAVVVVDNIAAGPSIGGVRMGLDVTTEEVVRLARSMTLKNAMAHLPHGGGKACIIADPKRGDKEHLVRLFARSIRSLKEYIPGPDMGTDETSMAYVYDEIERAVGLPRELGGIPLDEIGSTAYGVSVCVEVANDYANLELEGALLTVEGFGSVGKNTARFLAEKGVRLIAASDTTGTIYNPEGLDVEELIRVKETLGSVTKYKDGEVLETPDLLVISTDILVPAARPDSINMGNADVIDAKLIVEGANIAVTEEASKALYERGIIHIPDFVANAGGVITASVEYHGGTETHAFDRIEKTIRRNTREILDKSIENEVSPMESALRIAKQRVLRAMKYREWM